MTLSPRGELRDLLAMTTERWDFDGPVSFGAWMAPATVTVSGDLIVSPREQEWRDVRPDAGMLEAFLRLADAAPKRIAAYAQRWGPLRVCREHMLPLSHQRHDEGVSRGAFELDRCHHLEIDGDSATPIATWAHWAAQARAILRLAAKLHDQQLGEADDWRVVADEGLREWRREMWRIAPYTKVERDPDGREWIAPNPPYGTSLITGTASWRTSVTRGVLKNFGVEEAVELERHNVAQAVNGWLRLAGVQPSFRWWRRGPDVSLGGGGLFGALGVQIMLRVARTDGLAICSGCGEPYVPPRRPVAGRRRYCDTCRENNVPMKDAVADYRRRGKKPRRRQKHDSGSAVGEAS